MWLGCRTRKPLDGRLPGVRNTAQFCDRVVASLQKWEFRLSESHNVALLKEHLGDLQADDGEKMASMLHPDLKYWISPDSAFRERTTENGRGGAAPRGASLQGNLHECEAANRSVALRAQGKPTRPNAE
jgi:hypothetical protein